MMVPSRSRKTAFTKAARARWLGQRRENWMAAGFGDPGPPDRPLLAPPREARPDGDGAPARPRRGGRRREQPEWWEERHRGTILPQRQTHLSRSALELRGDKAMRVERLDGPARP